MYFIAESEITLLQDGDFYESLGALFEYTNKALGCFTIIVKGDDVTIIDTDDNKCEVAKLNLYEFIVTNVNEGERLGENPPDYYTIYALSADHAQINFKSEHFDYDAELIEGDDYALIQCDFNATFMKFREA